MNKKYGILNFTIEDMRELIRNGNDDHFNQIRVTKDGSIYLSEDVIAMDELNGIRYRMETFDPRNNYVGTSAAADKKFIESLYLMFKTAWDTNYKNDFLDEFFMPLSYDN